MSTASAALVQFRSPAASRLVRIALIAVMGLASAVANAQMLAGKVVGVTDGDTITVLDARQVQHKVRLSGIDAPERRQAFGQRARETLSKMVFSRLVEVEFEKTDRYDRILGKIWVNGRDVNLAMVQAGMAWHYKQYARDQSREDRRLYDLAEQQARDSGLGLWADRDPTPPWAWRREARKPTPPEMDHS